jgi:hypothetical protein
MTPTRFRPTMPTSASTYALSPDRTRVNVQMDWEPEGAREKIGSALGFDDRRVKGDLRRFKSFIEERGAETGGWRGNIGDQT